ncbi:hypothetical protein SCCGRSA3_00854 [Marine Group I thaumarchaeote SCGC RSA3]|uniref:YcfA-like protein n=3 Tax=Marine Group I TaxID=905826 RepID=A0A081RLA9_9ARCH|nr:hypothetical protein AAA799N04_01596 [Marine Group I thaumarchaeote SCGC AAA799-N04]KFM16848.1 hypothetical protein AAA799D11_00408 [Marine Group I thaumarchaeote SCGC AAA799-D11]KFM18905.1 hypothetical protein SCCGRSA3_00854 [Marine Group I thaumarchaeote SCGC RSA3]
MKIKDYPELSWKQIQQVLENKGYVEIQMNEKCYIHLQKDKKNVRIIKVEKVPRLFLQHIINETRIPIEAFVNAK